MAAWLLAVLALCLTDEGITECSVDPIQPPTLSKVSCPPIRANKDQFSYLLLLNNSYISKIRLTKQPVDNLISGHFEVTPSSSGVYVCKSEGIYPPPFTEDCHSTEVKVDPSRVQAETTDVRPDVNGTAASVSQSCEGRSPLIPEEAMWAACGVLLLYGLSVSCVAFVIWRKRKEENCAVYMNTRRADPKRKGKP